MRKVFFLLSALLLIITLALFAADAVANNPELQAIVASWGYAGVTLVGLIAGLNVIVPMPAATFTPVFLAAGLWLPFIIVAMTAGILVADYIGYAFGRWSRIGITEKYPKLLAQYEKLVTRHRIWLLPVIFLYASFAPFPNEAIILPLAVLGVHFKIMFLPLLFSGLIHQTIFSYGAQNLFLWWF